MTKHFSWEPPVSADSSYFRLRRFSFSSITGFLPFLVKMGPWALCWKVANGQTPAVKHTWPQTLYSRTSHTSLFFSLWRKQILRRLYCVGVLKRDFSRGGTEVHTSSDAVEAVLASLTDSWDPSTSPMGSALVSEPVGRPRSCRTCELQKSKH